MKAAGPDGCPRDDCDGVMRHAPTPNWPTRWVCDTCRSVEVRDTPTAVVLPPGWGLGEPQE